MRRIETKTKGKITDANGKSFDGFVERDPSGGEQSTHLSDNWCNNLQEEICNVIEGVGGQIVSGSDAQVEKYDQMFQAIKLLVDAVTPIGSVKAMSVKMTENIAKWVPIDEDDDDASIIGTEGTAYLSKQMAKNCEQVDGDKAGWYKLISINKENGEPSAVSGWALADGTFPLPLKPFGEDDGTRPEPQVGDIISIKNGPPKLMLQLSNYMSVENGHMELLSDTEYGKIWRVFDADSFDPGLSEKEKLNRGRLVLETPQAPFFKRNMRVDDDGDASSVHTGWMDRYREIHYINNDWFSRNRYNSNFSGTVYFLKDKDLLPPKDDTPIDTRTWTANNTKKPKLIPNLNDRTFLMGSNQESLSLVVEGKNGFMMEPYHMPPHAHPVREHKLGPPLSDSGSSGGDTRSPSSGENLGHGFTDITGGYWTSASYTWKDENGDPISANYLNGTIPIDLRPKRLSVYYYIRVV